MYSILDLLSLVMEEGQQIKRRKLMPAVRKAFKVVADYVVGLFQCHYRKKLLILQKICLQAYYYRLLTMI